MWQNNKGVDDTTREPLLESNGQELQQEREEWSILEGLGAMKSTYLKAIIVFIPGLMTT